MKYRAEIDGLRAFAIVSVILFHAGFGLFSGGFVGIDVFFVISGYLITTILIEDIENKQFSIVNFYERRARRILPALLLVVIFSVAVGFILLDFQDLRKLGWSAISSSLFFANINAWLSVGYFESNAALNPLLHIWSLSLEEQFYIFFPLFLIIFWRFGKLRLVILFSVISLGSLGISEWASRSHPVANYFLLPSRIWELLVGSLAAIYVQKKGLKENNVAALLGLFLVAVSVFYFDKTSPYPSTYTLIPVCGTALLIVYAQKETLAARILRSKVFVLIGLVSYSAYLWHQPLFAFYKKYYAAKELSLLASISLITATFFLAFFSWKYVENPFRSRKIFSRNQVVIILLCLMLIAVFNGWVVTRINDSKGYYAAKNISEGNVTPWYNMDERSFTLNLLSNLKDKRKVSNVYIGSSRLMAFDSNLLESASLNLSVSSAQIQDLYSLSLAALVHIKPDTFVIGADPGLLVSEKGDNSRWETYGDLYKVSEDIVIRKKPINKEQITRIVNSNNERPSGWIYDLYEVLNVFSATVEPNGINELVSKKLADGRLVYDISYVEGSNQRLASSVKKFEEGWISSAVINQSRIDLFTNLLDFLKDQGKNVIIVLSPYHPSLFESLSSVRKNLENIETEYRILAGNRNTTVLGSFNARLLDCSSDEFFDVMHFSYSCAKKVISFNSIVSNINE